MTTKPIRLVREVDTDSLPPELQKELSSLKSTNTDYSLPELVLAFLKKFNRATSDDLLIYIYQIRGSVASRGYLYKLVHQLRARRLLEPKTDKHTDTYYRLTDEGWKQAPEYIEPGT